MTRHGGSSIVTHYIDMFRRYHSWGEVPVGLMMDIGLFNLMSIHIQRSLPEFNCLAWETNNTFEQHDTSSCETNGYHVKALYWCKEVLWAPAEGKGTIAVGGLHALSLDAQGNKDIAEDQIAETYQYDEAEEISSVQRGEEKSA